MRKVPKNIPVKSITDGAIKERLSDFNDREPSEETKRKLTEAMGRLGRENNAVIAIEFHHEMFDTFMELEVNDYAVCATGCAHCCKVRVDVSAIEAAYIEEKTGIKFNRKVEKHSLGRTKLDCCPFLDKKKAMCSIYEYRPLECRAFVSLDSWKPCKDGTKHALHNSTSQPFMKQSVKWMVANSLELSRRLGVPAVADVRDWFG